MMQVMDIHVERTISAPAETVAPFFFNVANNLLWQSGMKSCDWTSEPPIAVGSTYEQSAEFRNKPVVSTFEVTEYEAGEMMRIESIKSTFPIQVTRWVEPIDESSCLVRAHVEGQPNVFLKIFERIGQRLARKAIEADYDRLVEYFEEPTTEDDGPTTEDG